MIQYAGKYKYYPIVEILIQAGVTCPADIKRKIDRNNNKSASTRPTRERNAPADPDVNQVEE